MTKEERKIYKKKYYENNKEFVKKQANNYHNKNKDEINKKRRESYKHDKEKINNRNKSYYDKNKKTINKRQKENYQENKNYIKNKAKNYRDNNREKINKHVKDRKNKEPLFKLRLNIGNSILRAIKNNGYKKKSKTQEILGCSFEQFKAHLESKFESWMTWDNHGSYNGTLNYGWDIDHIIPISSAKIEEELIKLNHYTNLQPLCGYTNRYIKRGIV